MSYIDMNTIEAAKQDLHDFIQDNFAYLYAIVAKAPTSYSIRSSSYPQDVAWDIGFRRCLAELQRIAESERRRSGVKEPHA